MKTPFLLHIFSPTKYVSPFDINMAYEAHYDDVIPYCNVTLDEIHPLGYCPEGDAIADACVYLLSAKARFVTGHVMHVSGGAELGYKRTL